MDEKQFQVKLAELMSEISTLPAGERAKLEELAAATQNRHQKLRKTVTDLQESLDYLRLSIKYLMFDLEATRRENNYLRKMLEEESRNSEDDLGEDEGGML
ncbi:transcriptional regulator [Planctomycetales bacterium ZRK34]|nr:transcriptional regulator [Planctomycetales bacterium ZRK34]